MKENDQNKTAKHLNSPAESNREKHCNFTEAEDESAEKFVVDQTLPDDRQKEGTQGVEGGRKTNQDPPSQQSPMSMDEDDTLGIP